MKIAIIDSVSGKSSKILREALNTRSYGVCTAESFKPYKINRSDFTEYDYVLSLGCSVATQHKQRLNKASSVKKCVNKTTCFDVMRGAGVNTVEYVTDPKKIPKHWAGAAVRQSVDGRKAEDLSFWDRGEPLPVGALFTEYFDHKEEYRIMVFNGEVVGRYNKRRDGEDWYFDLVPSRGFKTMDEHCEWAAKALDIDYVGFDVVAKSKTDFAILEANSGALMTDEAETAIIEYFINL